MTKEIKDYLHLYLGCECRIGDSPDPHHVLMVNETGLSICTGINVKGIPIWYKTAHAKLVLRPLSDMTDEEWKAIMLEFSIDIVDAYNSYIRYGDKPKHILILENRLTTNTLKFNDGMILLRKYFDLFGLIESGIAIDKTTIK